MHKRSFEPMAPIDKEEIPEGEDWIYQLKWDGVRLISQVNAGQVSLFSRRGLSKDRTYPELVELLAEGAADSFIVDGEVVVVDPASGRPVFQKVLQRERSHFSQRVQTRYPIIYVLFDLLAWKGESWLDRPLRERDAALRQLFPDRHEQLFVTDSFTDGKALWNWVDVHRWEGIVAKRLSSRYFPGKKHQAWFKKKTKLILEVIIVGFTRKEGRVSSLVMAEGKDRNIHSEIIPIYLGKVAIGLSMELRQKLQSYAIGAGQQQPVFSPLPAELKGDSIQWFARPLQATVQGQEFTSAGALRHPKLIHLQMEDSL